MIMRNTLRTHSVRELSLHAVLRVVTPALLATLVMALLASCDKPIRPAARTSPAASGADGASGDATTGSTAPEQAQPAAAAAAGAELVAGPPSPPAGVATPPPAMTTGACADRFAAIDAIYKGIPSDFRGLAGDPLRRVTTDVKNCSQALRQFLAECPDATDAACQARLMLARTMLSLRAVFRAELVKAGEAAKERLDARLREYHEGLLGHANEFLACAPENSPLRADAHKLIADTYFNNAPLSGDDGEYRKAFESYEIVRQRYPGFSDMKNVLLSAANSLLQLGEGERGVRYTREAMEVLGDTDYLPYYYDLLWKLQLVDGNFDGMIAVSDELLRLGPEKAKGPGNSMEELAWLRYYGFAPFRKGDALWAKGEPAAALEAFQAGLVTMGEINEGLTAVGRTFPPELGIYTTRIQKAIEVLETLYGEPAARDLGGLAWATPRRARLEGKTTAIIFQSFRSARSREFYQALDRYVGQHPDTRQLVSIHWRQGSAQSLEKALDLARATASEYAIANAAVGVDPEPTADLLRSFKATVGSGTFVVLDSRGVYEYWVQDPTAIDIKYAIKIIDRVAGN